MTMQKLDVDAELKKLESQSRQLNEGLQKLFTQRAQIDRQIQATREEHLRLEGRWQAFQFVKGDKTAMQKPELKIPSKKNRQKKKEESTGEKNG